MENAKVLAKELPSREFELVDRIAGEVKELTERFPAPGLGG